MFLREMLVCVHILPFLPLPSYVSSSSSFLFSGKASLDIQGCAVTHCTAQNDLKLVILLADESWDADMHYCIQQYDFIMFSLLMCLYTFIRHYN